MFYYTTVHGNNQVCPVPDCRMGKKGLETMSQGAHLPMLIFLQFFTALFLNRFDYSRQVSQRFVMPRTWNGWCTWLWTIFSWCFPVLDGEVSTCTSVSSHPYRPSKVSQICVSMNVFTLGRGPTSARYVDPPQSGYQLYRLYPTVLSRAQEWGIVPTMRLESFEKEQKLYFCLHIIISFNSGTQNSDQQKELWTEVISGYSNDADMRWSPEQIREFHIDLHGDAPIAPYTCSS